MPSGAQQMPRPQPRPPAPISNGPPPSVVADRPVGPLSAPPAWPRWPRVPTQSLRPLPPPATSGGGGGGATASDDAGLPPPAAHGAPTMVDALAAVALADAEERDARHSARHARADASSRDAALSPLSADGGGRGSTSGGTRDPDPAREQQNIVALTSSLAHASDAIGFLTAHARRYPLTTAALREAGGAEGSPPAVLQDFSVLVLLPAVHAAKQQEHGLYLLHGAASRDRTCAASVRAEARLNRAALFDVACDAAIRTGRVRVTVSPLDLCLGVVPVAQLALYVFLENHAYRVPAVSPLIAEAQKVSFVTNGRLHPAGIDALYAAWGLALGEGQDIPHAEIMFHLVEALTRDAEAAGAAGTKVPIAGVPTSWTDFAFGVLQRWQDDHSGLTGAKRTPDPGELRALFYQIDEFARRSFATAHVPGSIYPPTPGYTARCISAGGVPPAPPPSPPRPPRTPRAGPASTVVARVAGMGSPAAPAPAPPGALGARPHRGAVHGETVYLRIPFLVVPGGQSILSTAPLVAAGWVITLSAADADSFFTVPGVPGTHPLWRDTAGNYYASFVVARGGVVIATQSAAHARLVRHHFLLDSGAEVSIVGPGGLSLLRELGSRPIPTLRAVAGPALPVLDTGILLLVLPAGATRVVPVLPAPPARVAPDQAARTPGPDGSPPPGAAAAPEGGAQAPELHVAAARTSAFPPIKDVMTLASRFNLNTAAAITAFVEATPLGLADGLAAKVDAGTDYSQGYAPAAILKAPPIHAARYEISMAIRDATPPGSVWWTDVSNVRPEDFDGNVVSRLFAEERTGYAITYYSPRKDTATLVDQIAGLASWVAANVPGGELRVLRCDFATEAVKQGHGDDIYTAGIRAYCDANPRFRLMPVAPHSPALNRAEGTWGRIVAGTMLNARRARVGPTGWSLMERGTVYQHNHSPAPHALDPASHACSRSEALTLRVFDASTMLGYPGQTGWTHRPDGKANALRSTADPVLYLCPSEAMHAQLVFNLRNFKIMVVRDVALSVDPFGCSLILAGTALHRPSGAAFEPTPDAYEARLNALLLWSPVAERDHAVVSHDPILGLPTAIAELTPYLTEDGTIIMLSPSEAAPDEGPAPGAGPAAAGGLLAPLGPTGGPALPATGWTPTWLEPRAQAPAADVATLRQRMNDNHSVPGRPPWPLRFCPQHVKRGSSQPRWEAYSGATTFADFLARHAAYRLAHPHDKNTWSADLRFDLKRGHAQAAPPAPPVGASPAVARAVVSGGGPRALGAAPCATAAPRPGPSPLHQMIAADAAGGAPWALHLDAAPHTGPGRGRRDACRPATTLREYRALHAAYVALHPADSRPWRRDLALALSSGRSWAHPPASTGGPSPACPGAAAPAPLGGPSPAHPWTAWEPQGSAQGTDPYCRRTHYTVLRASLDLLSAEVPDLVCSGAPEPGAYAAEAARIAELDALEPAPPPDSGLGDGSHPDTVGDPRPYTSAYASGLRVLRLSLAEDYAAEPPLPRPDGGAAADECLDLESLSTPAAAWGVPSTGHVSPTLAFMAAPVAGAPPAPASVTAARRLPDFDAPNGWRQAINKEITRVEGFKAWGLASAGEVRAARARYGDSRVSIGYIVAILTCKLDPAGAARAPEIVNKFRVAVADKADAASGVITHSNCVDDITNRLITAIAPAIGAEQDSIDIGGAYFHGVPPDMEHGGRKLYARIPTWLAALYPDRYPLRGSRGTNFLIISGNMPGRCDAGRIWQARLDTFLRGYGMRQAETDRRVWTLHTTDGSLIVHDHVDDSRITATTPAARMAFHSAWAAEFRETITTRALSEDFTGLRHTRIDALTTSVSCEGVIRKLGPLLESLPLLSNEKCDWPLPMLAPRTLEAGPSATNPLAPHLAEVAAPILGTIGFVAGMARPDAYFAFCVLSRYAGAARITTYAFRRIVCLGHYLLRTIGLHLRLTTPPLTRAPGGTTNLDLLACYVDSSNGNAEHGASYGGFVLASCGVPPDYPRTEGAEAGPHADEHHGGGAIAWRCSAPPQGDDSSGASELRMATLAYKYLLAALLLLDELHVGVTPSGPTPFYLDAQAVLDGTTCERLAKKSRWMAMRYAMLRWGIACGTINPRKLPSARNPSDGLTKCLVGRAFENARARLLGHPVPHPGV